MLNNVCLIVIGMSGTGKTTLIGRLQSQTWRTVYTINLDPAVHTIPYVPIIDIRATHQYKKIMKQYKLGPNGAILTALNLYAAQPQNIVDQIKSKADANPNPKLFLIDIPGQIEIFTWSSSSLILTQAISTIMPVKILYIIDSLRCQNSNVFLSNLLFAQSIQYRLWKYQFELGFNKADCANAQQLETWMGDYEEFMSSLQKDQTYLATLSKSIVLHLSQFYQKIPRSCISAKTGAGLDKIRAFIDANKLIVQNTTIVNQPEPMKSQQIIMTSIPSQQTSNGIVDQVHQSQSQ